MFRYKLRTLLIVLALGICLAGCSRPVQPSSPPIGMPATYLVEVHGGSFTQTAGGSTIYAGAGLNYAKVENGRLTVNGEDYGVLANADEIVVKEDGVVTVNGTVRKPRQDGLKEAGSP